MVFSIIFMVFISSENVKNFSNASTISEIFVSLNKALEYSHQNPELLGLSGIFGIVRAKALISSITSNKNGFNSIFSLIEKTCDEILRLRMKLLEPYDEWVKNITDPVLWIKNISYKDLIKKCYRNYKNKRFFDELINEAGTACITPEMFEFCLNDSYYMSMNMNPACYYFFMRNYQGIGYETTHRLLFIQIARIWKIIPNVPTQLVESLCKFIYKQAEETGGRTFFFDLFMEQVFLCGVEGYREFLDTKWLRIILDNQLEEGCFPYFSKTTELNSSTYYNRLCSDHATGLASATLALHLHYRLEYKPSE